MCELYIDLRNPTKKIVRMSSPPMGFTNESITMAFAAQQSLFLNFFSFGLNLQYQVSVEGAANLVKGSSACEIGCYYSISWTEEAIRNNDGQATVRIVNPHYPSEVFVIDMSIGEYRFTSTQSVPLPDSALKL